MKDFALPLGVLLFGALIIGLEIMVMVKRQRGWGAQSSRMVGITLVVVAAMFLATSSIGQDKIAPAIGLLGTVAGYLLGKNDKDT